MSDPIENCGPFGGEPRSAIENVVLRGQAAGQAAGQAPGQAAEDQRASGTEKPDSGESRKESSAGAAKDEQVQAFSKS
ncbi:hypothetical protein BDY19DRAFT_998863 [Irpex rosettiformis]|uniref:Uncharacterized protein n=1 Tax=Irpex rosettiformis TaxID=378272 RepID=A0ACB8TM71_9APHY|nr:hypothetical protein BDY19DRAFT_998863 [Irpex rosettiformis]